MSIYGNSSDNRLGWNAISPGNDPNGFQLQSGSETNPLGGSRVTNHEGDQAFRIIGDEKNSAPVPEPASMLDLLTIGAIAAGGTLKKKASV